MNLWNSKALDLNTWVQSFCEVVKGESGGQSQWLMGYSLGGRLAIHALLEQPGLWAGVIVIGAHPGFSTETERKEQLLRDQVWGNRFLTEPWDDLMKAWDALPVFGGHPNPWPREESAFSRTKIAHLFDIFSKGRQQNLLPQLARLSKSKLLLITGEEDKKYGKINNRMLIQCPSARHIIIPNACHRVPWEATDAFKETVQQFLYTYTHIK